MLTACLVVPAPQEAEAGGFLEPAVQGQPGQHRKMPKLPCSDTANGSHVLRIWSSESNTASFL
jgi:hypothetical protein